jgi:hypothetical protein
MTVLTLKPIFNHFIFNKINFGLWRIPVKRKLPRFSGYNFRGYSKWGVSWLGYLLEVSWLNNKKT